MRIALSLLVLLFVVPRHTAAGPVVEMEFLNSNLTFGESAGQWGWDLSSFWAPGFDDASWNVWNTGYQAVSGTLGHQTFLTDGEGHVTGTEYVYLGGTFEIFFVLENGDDVRIGSFLAPIERLTVFSGEEAGTAVELLYVLGAGVFDETISGVLGIPRRTAGGHAYGQLLLTDEGTDPTSRVVPDHQASDGVNDITLEVPEPAGLALLGCGLVAVWRRRRRPQLEPRS